MQENLLFSTFAILGLIQVLWLPGWLISHVFRQQINTGERTVLSLVLSLIFNSCLIFPLTALHLYTKNVLLCLISIEVIILLVLEKNFLYKIFTKKVSSLGTDISSHINTSLYSIKKWFEEEIISSTNKTYKIIVFSLSILTIIYLLYLFISNVGTLFNLSDAIFSWNRWAMQWASNTLPTDTWEYPQLLPINWSIFYVLIGQSGEFLAKIIMPIFPIIIAISLFSLGIKTRKNSFILSVFTIFFLLRMMNGYEIMATEGYADTAVSLFSLIPVLIIYFLQTKELPQEKIKMWLLFGTIFSVAALLTKQTGIFIAIFYPIISIIYLYKSKISTKVILKYLSIYISLIILLVGPYYIYKEVSIIFGQDISVIPTINNLIHGQNNSWSNIFYNAILYTVKKTYLLIIVYYISVLYLLFRGKSNTLLFSIPAIAMTLFWTLFLSYDSRNLTLGVLFLGICLAIAIDKIANSESKVSILLKKTKIYLLFVLLILFILLSSPFTKSKIQKSYNREKRLISNKELSTNISTYFGHNLDNDKIYSNFALLHFLPDTQKRLLELNPEHFTNADNFKDYFTVIKNNKKIGYILAANYSKPEILSDIKNRIHSGEFTKIFDIEGFILVKINQSQK